MATTDQMVNCKRSLSLLVQCVVRIMMQKKKKNKKIAFELHKIKATSIEVNHSSLVISNKTYMFAMILTIDQMKFL